VRVVHNQSKVTVAGYQVQLTTLSQVAINDAPVIVFIPGIARSGANLLSFFDILSGSANIICADLPGQGGSSAIPYPTIERQAKTIGEAVAIALGERRPLLVGESVGGLVAAQIAANRSFEIEAVLLLDPPLTTGKQWHMYSRSVARFSGSSHEAAISDQLTHVMGFGKDGIQEKLYYDMVAQIEQPIIIAHGDISLFPPRNLPFAPAMIEPIDRYILSRITDGHVQFHTIGGAGHLLVDHAPEACVAFIRSVLGDRVKEVGSA